MQIAFRTDASKKIGTGHFMRCLTLAIELQRKGANIHFLSRNLPEYLIQKLQLRGMNYISILESSLQNTTDDLLHSEWLETTQAEDARLTVLAVENLSLNWLIVDHYSLDHRWEVAVRSRCKKIMVIDDLADRIHDCDVLLDQNFSKNMHLRYKGKVPESCQIFLGPSYALVREDFRSQRELIKPRGTEFKKVLIFFGGIDSDNYTGLAIQALTEISIKLKVDVVIGAHNPNCEDIKRQCMENEYTCHVETDRMAELMANADLAIGAGGSAMWERCCVGLPTFTFCLAENQREQLSEAADAGLVYFPRKDCKDLIQYIKLHMRCLLENHALLHLISKSGMSLVNGRGALKIANALLSSDVMIREVTLDDSYRIYTWRNHSEIRRISLNENLFSWDDHQVWFANALADANKVIVLGEVRGEIIGVVRFDIADEKADVSIYLVPDGGFEGYGKSLLSSAERWVSKNKPQVKMLSANVLWHNEISKKFFSNLNYQIDTVGFKKYLN